MWEASEKAEAKTIAATLAVTLVQLVINTDLRIDISFILLVQDGSVASATCEQDGGHENTLNCQHMYPQPTPVLSLLLIHSDSESGHRDHNYSACAYYDSWQR